TAEALSRLVRRSAGRAVEHEWGAALGAELAPRAVLGTARGAAHNETVLRLQEELEIRLVADPDLVCADRGDLRLEHLSRAVDCAPPEGLQAEATALIEAERVQIVVGGREPDDRIAVRACCLHRRVHEHGADAGVPRLGVDGDDLAALAFAAVRDVADDLAV